MNGSVTLISEATTRRKLTQLLGFIIFFSVLNGTMFHIAIPDIAGQFDLTPSEVSWVMTGYIVLFALGSVTYGKLADMYPVKNLITTGLLLLNAGSLIGFFAEHYIVLIAARIVQASGGAAIPALSMLVVTQYFPRDTRGRVFGVIASTVALATGVGPILGGFITAALHWRYLFVLSLATLFTIPFFRKLLPEEQKRPGRFDTAGALLMGGGVASILFFVTQTIWWCLPLSIVLLLWFVAHISRTGVPFVKPALFLNRHYRNTLLTTFLSMGTVFGMMFMTPLMLRDLNRLDADYIGLVTFPGALSAALIGTYGGKLADRHGSIPVVHLGLGFLIAGFFLLSTFAGLSPPVISLNLILCYMGFSFIQSSLAHTVSMTLPKSEMGIGMGIYSLFFFMSGGLSAAAVGKLLDFAAGGFPVNPFSMAAPAAAYSNIFTLLAFVVLCASGLFYLSFRKTGGTGV